MFLSNKFLFIQIVNSSKTGKSVKLLIKSTYRDLLFCVYQTQLMRQRYKITFQIFKNKTMHKCQKTELFRNSLSAITLSITETLGGTRCQAKWYHTFQKSWNWCTPRCSLTIGCNLHPTPNIYPNPVRIFFYEEGGGDA